MENKKMKLKEDLLERVRKGELIVDNDNPNVIRELWPIAKGDDRYYVQDNTCHSFKFNCTGILTGSSLFLKSVIKASELIEREDYTKPLEKGQLCVFFDDLLFFRVMFYFYRLGDVRPHIDHNATGWKYAFPYEGQTQAEIEEKINSYLKDK